MILKTNNRFRITTVIMVASLLLLATNCSKDEDVIKTTTIPVLTTDVITNITQTTATCSGNVTSDGGAVISARGICWSTNQLPTKADSKTTLSKGLGSFTSVITGLAANTRYYIRAYATNSTGTGYGNTLSFITDSLINMVYIPAGTFTMGSPNNEVNRDNDETQHQVTINAFRIARYEITNAQYAIFLNAKGVGSNGIYEAGTYPTNALIYSNSNWGLIYTGKQWEPVAGYENNPVINVSWYGAAEFATYVGGTLPTEAQWEYACRGGTTTPFNTGTCLTNEQANYNWNYPYNTCINTITSSTLKTKRVGTYTANAYGLYDMHGNVWEWCNDLYGTYPTTTTTITNPTGATTGIIRVIRGGGWGDWAHGCRSADRNFASENGFNYNLGFRVVQLP